MTQSTPSVSDSELEVLKVLWATGPATVRYVLGYLEKSGRSWAYTTVQTLLLRLQHKGFVESRKEGRAHVYRAGVDQKELLSRELDELAERVCDGAASPLVLSLVEGRRFSAEEIRQLRELLDRLEGETGSK